MRGVGRAVRRRVDPTRYGPPRLKTDDGPPAASRSDPAVVEMDQSGVASSADARVVAGRNAVMAAQRASREALPRLLARADKRAGGLAEAKPGPRAQRDLAPPSRQRLERALLPSKQE
jgi:hypothetical protein